MPRRPSTKPASPIGSFADALKQAGKRPAANAQADEKKNYAEKLSRHLATLFATSLRPWFREILPHDDGSRQESRARTSKGVKKLDVNYSTPELGLGLGVSIKTINYIDARSRRYTKNYTRVDNELRAEAMDYHLRQPYSVLIAVLFLPSDATEDGRSSEQRSARGASSFGSAVQWLRNRGMRTDAKGDAELFEACYVGLYDHDGANTGRVEFFDIRQDPPRRGRPTELMNFQQLLKGIIAVYDARNNPTMHWAGEGTTGLPSVEPTAALDGDDDE